MIDVRELLRLNERSSLVIGGASGIGRAAAEALAALGARVVVGDVAAEAGAEVVAGIRAGGGAAEFLPVDVLVDASVEDAVAERLFGGLDILVNSAGRLQRDGDNAFVNNVDMFLHGVWRGMHYGIPALQRRGGGAIVNVSSIAGLTGSRGPAGYGPAKHGVISITKSWALECAQDGIRVNAVCPGYVATGLTQAYLESEEDARSFVVDRHRVPMARWGMPDEIATGIAYLASDAASFVTGHALVMDGGLLSR